jgi:hypothetical protein
VTEPKAPEPSPKRRWFPYLAEWKHNGWFGPAVAAVVAISVMALNELTSVTPWMVGLIAGGSIMAIFGVADFALRRRARRDGRDE